jgi:hypothetical protein
MHQANEQNRTEQNGVCVCVCMYEPRQKPICMCTDSRSQKQPEMLNDMWQPSWGTLTIAIFHQIFTHWANFFSLLFWGKEGLRGGGGGGEGVEIISWTSMQDRDYHMSQELTMPLSPLHPSVFLPFSSSSTDVRTCAPSQHSGYEASAPMSLLKGGGHP